MATKAIDFDTVDEIGIAADTLDNLVAASKMPLPSDKKLQYTVASLQTLSDNLKSIFVRITGENPWSDTND